MWVYKGKYGRDEAVGIPLAVPPSGLSGTERMMLVEEKRQENELLVRYNLVAEEDVLVQIREPRWAVD